MKRQMEDDYITLSGLTLLDDTSPLLQGMDPKLLDDTFDKEYTKALQHSITETNLQALAEGVRHSLGLYMLCSFCNLTHLYI